MQTTLTWYKPSERLPDFGKRVLVAYAYGGVALVRYQPATTVYWWAVWDKVAMWAYIETPKEC